MQGWGRTPKRNESMYIVSEFQPTDEVKKRKYGIFTQNTVGEMVYTYHSIKPS